jgi:hypothetical protein
MASSRPDPKTNSRFIDYLNVYYDLKEDDYKKLNDDHVLAVSIYNKEWAENEAIKLESQKWLISLSDTPARIITSYFPRLAKPVRDPRLDSRDALSAALIDGDIGHFGRVFNQFKFTYLNTSVLNDRMLQRYLGNIYKIAADCRISRDEEKSTIIVDTFTDKRLKQLAADMVFMSCQELLDEKGMLHSEITRILGLERFRVNEKWKNNPVKLSEMTSAIIWSYCSTFLVGAFSEPDVVAQIKDVKKSDEMNETLLLLMKYIQQIFFSELEKGVSVFLSEQRNNYQFYRYFITDLEKLSPQQVSMIVRADVSLVMQNARLDKLTEQCRMEFWNNIVNYFTRNLDLSAKHEELAGAVMLGLVGELVNPETSLDEKAIIPFSSTIQLWLNIRDNRWFIDDFIAYISVNKVKLTADALQFITQLKFSSQDLIQQPINIILKQVQDKFSFLSVMVENYLKEITPFIHHDSSKLKKLEIPSDLSFWGANTATIPKLPTQELALNANTLRVNDDKEATPFVDDLKGVVYSKLQNDIKAWQSKHLGGDVTKTIKSRYKHKIYLPMFLDSKGREILFDADHNLQVKKVINLVASLFSMIDEGLKKKPAETTADSVKKWIAVHSNNEIHEVKFREISTYFLKSEFMQKLVLFLRAASKLKVAPKLKEAIESWKAGLAVYITDVYDSKKRKVYVSHYQVLCVHAGFSTLGKTEAQKIIDEAVNKLPSNMIYGMKL